MQNTLKTIVVGFLAGLAGAYVFYQYKKENNSTSAASPQYSVNSFEPAETYKPTIINPSSPGSLEKVDFSEAATRAIPSVVYINSISQSGPSYSYWDQLFGGGGQQTQVSSGSGVIFTSDGYIVTNNHVVPLR